MVLATAGNIAPQLPIWLEVLAMSVSGLFGGIIAAKRGVPVLGVLIGGILFGLGGGVIRDVMLNVMPTAISVPCIIPAVGVAALLGGYLNRSLDLSQTPVLILQATYLGLLLLIGAEKAMDFGVSFCAIIALGMITAMAGGAMLDVLTGNRAALLSQGPWHLIALIAGSVGFIALSHIAPPLIAEIGTLVLVVILRLLAAKHGWHCPEFPQADSKGSVS